jgi:hypothetical protein
MKLLLAVVTLSLSQQIWARETMEYSAYERSEALGCMIFLGSYTGVIPNPEEARAKGIEVMKACEQGERRAVLWAARDADVKASEKAKKVR